MERWVSRVSRAGQWERGALGEGRRRAGMAAELELWPPSDARPSSSSTSSTGNDTKCGAATSTPRT